MPFPGKGTETFCGKWAFAKVYSFNMLKLKIPPWLKVQPCSENLGYVYMHKMQMTLAKIQ